MRLRGPIPRHVPGWSGGLIEGAEPDVSHPIGGLPAGIVDASENLVPTRTGRMAVRGGSAVVRSFTEPGAAALTRMLTLAPYSQTGALAIGHHSGTSTHYAYRLTDDLAFFTGAEGTSRHDIGWTTAAATKPQVVELFEKAYIVDGTATAGARQTLVSIDSAGTVTEPTFDLGGGAAALKPYCAAVFNGVLFIAGYDGGTVGSFEGAMVRHSLLGASPDSATGFDADAWAILGAQGQQVTAMAPGRSLLLIAKEHELYRLTGTGRARSGWQYVIQQLETSRGAVCPQALAHFEGTWFGVDESGPWRSDGESVVDLTGARNRTWPKVTSLTNAFVVPHPERRCILFGFCLTPQDAGRSSTYPWSLWVWDVDRGVWASDWKLSADLAHVAAIPSATPQGPSADPITLAIDHASATTTSVAASWDNNGDTLSSTEIWVRDVTGGGGSVLWQTAIPGDAAESVIGLDPSREYAVKIRHTKGGIAGNFTAEVAAYSKLAAPTMLAEGASSPDMVQLTMAHAAGGADLVVQRSAYGAGVYAGILTFAAEPVGTRITSDTTASLGVQYDYRAYAYRSTWPAAIDSSDYSNVDDATGGIS